MAQVKVTDPDKFGDTEVDVSLKNYNSAFHGDVEINGKTITGEHGCRDYEQEYGFIIIN